MYDPIHNFTNDGVGGALPLLGHEYLLTDSGQLVSGAAALSTASGSGTHSAGGSGSPASTLVGSASGLEINLVWDNSVRNASNWSAFESALVSAAKIFTSAFSNHVVINIAVGSGEVGGSALGAGALGESESFGYIANYATTVAAMTSADAGLLTSHGSSTSVLLDPALSTAHFFISSGEAKALNLVNGHATAIDGYIGLTSLAGLLYFPATGGAIKSTQYDAVGVAAHEISEVMGRVGMQGQSLGGYSQVYTPLDLFRCAGAHSPALTPGGGSFSINAGVTNLNTYNNPSNGGDSADWASLSSNRLDAFDAFANPGVVMNVTATDLLEVASLGFQVNPGQSLTTVTA
jgi:hypothetical protein